MYAHWRILVTMALSNFEFMFEIDASPPRVGRAKRLFAFINMFLTIYHCCSAGYGGPEGDCWCLQRRNNIRVG